LFLSEFVRAAFGLSGGFSRMHVQRPLAWFILTVGMLTTHQANGSPINVLDSFRGVDLEINRYRDIAVDLSDTSSDWGPYSELLQADVSLSSVVVNSFVSLDSMVGPDGISASGTAQALIEVLALQRFPTSSLVTTMLDIGFEVKEPVPFELSANVVGSVTPEGMPFSIAEVLLYGPGGSLVGVSVWEGTRSLAESGILEPGIYHLQAGALVQADALFPDDNVGGSASFGMSLVVPEVSTGLCFVFFSSIVVLRRSAFPQHI